MVNGSSLLIMMVIIKVNIGCLMDFQNVSRKIGSPLFIGKKEGKWFHFTLNGNKEIDLNAPVSNISYFEADAFARWNNKRLPTEFEWEVASNDHIQGNF